MAEKIGLIAIFNTQQFNRGLSDYLRGIGKANKGTESAEKSSFNFARALEVAVGNALVEVGKLVIEFATKVGEAVISTVQDAISLESAFAGVIKTTDGLTTSTGELSTIGEELKQGYRDLAKEVPIAVEELLEIGEIGGQLGIQRENLLEFTETIAALGVATNLSGEEAAVGLARFANVVGTSQDDIDNLGSAIVFLGNNFATTERDVLNFGSRIAGAGAIVGLTEGDILGIGAAFSSIGIEAAAGGTAVQKVLLTMNKAVLTGSDELLDFAAAAGVSAEDFATLWESDAAGAFEFFVRGLGEAGDDATQILANLGLEDQRLIRAFLGLSQNADLLKDAMDGANVAFDENTALAKEAETRFGTTESQIQIMKNSFRDFGFTIGEAVLPIINDLIPLFVEFAEQHGPAIAEAFETVVNAVMPFVEWIANAIVTGDLLNDFLADLPAGFQGIVTFIVGTVIPAFRDDLPQAIEFLKTAFSEGVAFIGTQTGKFEAFIENVTPIVEAAIAQIVAIWEALQDNIDIIWSGIQSIISGAIDIVLGVIQTGLAIARGDWDLAWKGIRQVAGGAWEFITGIIETAFGLILTIVGTNTDTLFTTIAQLWTIVKITTEQAWESVKTFIATAWDNIVSFVETGLTQLGEFFSTAWENIVTTVTTQVNLLLAAIDEFIISIETAWATFWENVRLTTETIWDAIVAAINTKIQELFTAMGLDLEAIKAQVAQIWEDIKLIGAKVWGAIVRVVKRKVKELFAAVDEKITEIKESWTIIWNSIKEIVEILWSSIETFITETIDRVRDFINTAIGEILVIWETTTNAISTVTTEIWTAISTFVSETIEGIKTTIDTVLKAIKIIVETLLGKIKTAFTNAFGDIIKGVKEKVEELKTAVKDTIQEILDAITTRFKDFVQLGKDLIRGIKEGVIAAAGALITAVLDAISAALDAAKKKLGMGSPSKVFAVIGLDVMKGFAGGIGVGANLPAQAMTGSIDGLMQTTANATTNNIDNSRNVNLEINNNGSNAGNTTFFDVVAGLQAVGI